MFARVTTVHGTPEKLDDGARMVQEQMMPLLQQQHGFKGAYLLVDRASGRALGITLWETREAMAASDTVTSPLRAQAGQAAGSDAPPAAEMYEVAVHA